MQTIVRAAAFAILCSALTSPAFGQSATWDQAKVTDLAAKLAAAVKDLKNTMRKAPDQPPGGPRRAQYSAREDVRLMENSAVHLAAQLKDGAGHDKTWPVFQRIQTLRRDAEESARKAMISETTMAKIVPARELLAELEPYYSTQ